MKQLYGGGNYGTIGSVVPEGEYKVNRVAFSIGNQIIANSTDLLKDTGAETIEGARMILADKYGVDVSEIEVSLHIGNEGDLGWLNKEQISYSDIQKNIKQDNKTLEQELEKINEKYDKMKIDSIQNEITSTDFKLEDQVKDEVSLGATLQDTVVSLALGLVDCGASVVDGASSIITLGQYNPRIE